MNRAFLAAERKRRRSKPPTEAQRRYLRVLADRAGIEVPEVRWASDASDAISRLECRLRQPTLEGI